MDILSSTLWVILTLGGSQLALPDLVSELAPADVVFLGEEHDNSAGHQAQLEILKALHARRPDLVLSMEMFERDVQGVLDDYLRGRIDEATFLAHSRPWGNYKEHYRPLVEYAKAQGLDVIAANAPRPSAKKLAEGGVVKDAFVARETTAPEDRYYALFQDAMKEHPGEVSKDAMLRMYAAQCLKDDTMAESIVGYLNARPFRRPMIVHVNGKFHSDHGLGTVSRVLSRRPLTRVSVITMESMEEPGSSHRKAHAALGRAHYLLAVKAEPKKNIPEAVKPDAAKKPETAATEKALVPEAAPGETPREKVEEEVPAPTEGKAALGIMPDYGSSEPGVTVSQVFEGRAASNGGIRDGDRIVKIGEERIDTIEDYMAALDGLRPNDKVKITVVRNGAQEVFEITLGVSRR